MDLHVIDVESGEVLQQITEKEYNKLKPKTLEDILRSTKAIEYKKEKTEFEKVQEEILGGFYFMMYKHLEPLKISKTLRDSDIFRYLYLCTYMHLGSNKLMTDEGNKIGKEDLKDLLSNLGERTQRDLIHKLFNLELLIEDNDYIVVNPKICYKGYFDANTSIRNLKKTKVFINSIRKWYKNSKPSQHGKLSLLFKLIPYTNVKYNAVCRDVLETSSLMNSIPYDIKEIAELLGYTDTNIRRFKHDILSLKINNELACGFFARHDITFLFVNPKIFYAGGANEIKDLNLLLELFGEKK